MDLFAWILTLSILTGQLIKIPIGTHGGVTILDLVMIVLSLVGLVKLKFRLKKPPLFAKAALLFIMLAILSLAITPLRLEPIQYFTSFSYIIRFSFFVLLGWLIYSQAFPNIHKNISNILTFSGMGLAILGLLQFIFLPDLRFLEEYGWDPHYFRTASTFLDPNFLGSYLVLTLILLIYPSFQKSRIRHVGIWIIVTIMYLALLTTFSRGSYLAFLTSFLTLSVLNKSIRLGIITIFLFLGLLLGFNIYQRLVAQPRNIDRAKSAEFRLNTWKQGWQLFSSHPILGVGFNAYRYGLKEYSLGDDKFLATHGASTNDSSLLYVAATTGTTGLISYLLFLGSLLKFGIKQNYLLAAGLLALITQSFFANTLFYPPLLLWVILMTAIQKK